MIFFGPSTTHFYNKRIFWDVDPDKLDYATKASFIIDANAMQGQLTSDLGDSRNRSGTSSSNGSLSSDDDTFSGRPRRGGSFSKSPIQIAHIVSSTDPKVDETQTNILSCIIGALGVILCGAYSLWLYNRIIFGNLKVVFVTKFKDVNKKEFLILLPLLILVLFMGVYPSYFSEYIHLAVCNSSLVTLY